MPPHSFHDVSMESELLRAMERINNPGVPNMPVALNMGLFDIRTLPGRNKGSEALRDIPKGTLVLAEEALFSIPNVHDLLTQDDETEIRAQATIHRTEFDKLYCHGRPTKAQAPLKRFVANSYQMDGDAEGPSRQGIFLKASQLNHSCVPNAYFDFNEKFGPQGHLTVYAIHDIRLGQEIVINYRQGDCYKTRPERKQILKDAYEFTCTCRACEPNTPFGRGSEGRRIEMATLETRIKDNKNSYGPREQDQRRQDIQKLIDLLEEEGLLNPQLAKNYRRLAKYWNEKWLQTGTGATDFRRGFSEKAMEAARKGLDLELTCFGSSSCRVTQTLKWLCGLECK